MQKIKENENREFFLSKSHRIKCREMEHFRKQRLICSYFLCLKRVFQSNVFGYLWKKEGKRKCNEINHFAKTTTTTYRGIFAFTQKGCYFCSSLLLSYQFHISLSLSPKSSRCFMASFFMMVAAFACRIANS